MANLFTIANNCNVPLNQKSGSIPNMGDALSDWFQYLTFCKVTKTTEAFQVVETMVEVNFWGIIYPLEGRQLQLLPEGQRAWSWFEVIAQAAPNGQDNGSLISLNVDDVGLFNGVQTRVMGRKNYWLYSYTQMHWAQDWYPGAGPTVT